MKRRLFTILSALSLVLFVAVVVLWVRSYRVEDVVAPSDSAYLCSRMGALTLLLFMGRDDGPPAHRHMSLPVGYSASSWNEIWLATEPTRIAGFGYGRLYHPGSGGFMLVAAPYWAAACVTGLLPAAWALRWRRVRGVRVVGICPSCGYDLRATPERCPECGMSA